MNLPGLLTLMIPLLWSALTPTLLALALPTTPAHTSRTAKVAKATPILGNRPTSRPATEFKYFKEPGRNNYLGHYDVRFFKGLVSNEQRTETLTHMMRAYLKFFDEARLDTWIAHGTLLGWWWNGKILPWDCDIDTQVPETTLTYLADHLNQTTVTYTSSSYNHAVTRKYLIDVNPFARQRDRGTGLNIIDARFVDTQTGLYIDITGVRKLHPDKEPDTWGCKNSHKYKAGDIYPLRTSVFEGVPAKVPFRYDSILIDEYTVRALAVTRFHNHTWIPDVRKWVLDEAKAIIPPKPKHSTVLMLYEDDGDSFGDNHAPRRKTVS